MQDTSCSHGLPSREERKASPLSRLPIHWSIALENFLIRVCFNVSFGGLKELTQALESFSTLERRACLDTYLLGKPLIHTGQTRHYSCSL